MHLSNFQQDGDFKRTLTYIQTRVNGRKKTLGGREREGRGERERGIEKENR